VRRDPRGDAMEEEMDKLNDRQESALIDLGAVEVETKGAVGLIEDTAGLEQPFMGLTDD
jgi:hypothetical protein